MTKRSSGSRPNDSWHDFLNDKSLRENHLLTNGNSPPPIPARNAQNKLLSNRRTHPSANGNGSNNIAYEGKTDTALFNGNSVTNSRRTAGNGYFSASPYSDKSFTAKRDFFQRNGSFQAKLAPSRSQDLIHVKNTYGIGGQPSQRRPMQVVNGSADYDSMSPAVAPSRKFGAEKIVGGAIYELAKNASSSAFTTPVIETTLKGKVTYLTDFTIPPTSIESAEHLRGSGTKDKDQKVA